jgi:hypothetical protein
MFTIDEATVLSRDPYVLSSSFESLSLFLWLRMLENTGQQLQMAIVTRIAGSEKNHNIVTLLLTQRMPAVVTILDYRITT